MRSSYRSPPRQASTSKPQPHAVHLILKLFLFLIVVPLFAAWVIAYACGGIASALVDQWYPRLALTGRVRLFPLLVASVLIGPVVWADTVAAPTPVPPVAHPAAQAKGDDSGWMTFAWGGGSATAVLFTVLRMLPKGAAAKIAGVKPEPTEQRILNAPLSVEIVKQFATKDELRELEEKLDSFRNLVVEKLEEHFRELDGKRSKSIGNLHEVLNRRIDVVHADMRALPGQILTTLRDAQALVQRPK